ncbi:MAG TPA: hypothetical protein VMW73_10565 [Spirochaetia bacterium]|nr:hypothetical protein [Spirochaetia bacterium]
MKSHAMQRAFIYRSLFAGLLFTLCPGAVAQQIRSVEFRNQPITDILLSLAKMSGNSIIADATVSGTTSYYFEQTDFERALTGFLRTNHLYVRRVDGVYRVSRVLVTASADGSRFSVEADNVELETVVRKISEAMGITILSDTLPREQITLHVREAGADDLLAILVRKYPDLSVERGKNYFYLKSTTRTKEHSPPRKEWVTRSGELYTVDAPTCRFREILSELFHKGAREYSLLLQSDPVLVDLHFADKSFDDLLDLVVGQANAGYETVGGLYYLFDIQKRDILKQLRRTVYLPLNYLQVKELSALLPQELATGSSMKLDAAGNTVVLFGSREEIAPVEAFIRTVDQPRTGRTFYRFDLDNMNVAKLLTSLPARFSGLDPIVVPGANSFLMLLSEPMRHEVAAYIELLDHETPGAAVSLKYLRADELVKSLPPNIDRADITVTNDSSALFFTGTREKLRQLREFLEVADRPTQQIRYELLVVQYQRSSSLSFESSFQGSTSQAAEGSVFVGTISKLLSLSFDIVSNFGTLFALKLNAALGNNSAQVLADTTLNGLSGQQLKFQNTNTYRYRDSEVDPETGAMLSTGVTREITSGLILGINGWASGDGMITMQVSATISKRGVDNNSGTSPPTTSEKIVTTNVRTRSGTPVVIGGLIQQDVDRSMSKVPILGDIPLLGLLFRSVKETIENTELVIYIVPHIEYPQRVGSDLRSSLERMHERFGTLQVVD